MFSDPPSYDESLLWPRLVHGDRKAFGVLYERHRIGLFRYCLRMLQDEDLAADAVHETFVKALLGIQALQDPLALRSWLYRIARNEALAALRYPERRGGSDPDLLQDPETPQTLAEQNNFREHVQAAVDTLSAEYREVLALREEEDLSYGEIAEVTGSSISAVKARLFKARRALVSRLRPVLSERKEDRDGVRNSSNEPQRMD